WDIPSAKLWATQKQLRYISERLQRPLLVRENDQGIIIVDAYESRDGAIELVDHFSVDMLTGTRFEKLDRISLTPLLADSKQCVQIQLADIIIGIVVGALGGNRYALELIEEMAPLFLWNPHERAVSFTSMVSNAILGFGLKIHPKEALYPAVLNAFRDVDS